MNSHSTRSFLMWVLCVNAASWLEQNLAEGYLYVIISSSNVCIVRFHIHLKEYDSKQVSSSALAQT